ncbi:MAG: hypothetical protein WCD18_00990 [Thermosynechococcaceae cyanobacterium]
MSVERFGIEQGMEQGAAQEARSLIVSPLTRRVGNLMCRQNSMANPAE